MHHYQPFEQPRVITVANGDVSECFGAGYEVYPFLFAPGQDATPCLSLS